MFRFVVHRYRCLPVLAALALSGCAAPWAATDAIDDLHYSHPAGDSQESQATSGRLEHQVDALPVTSPTPPSADAALAEVLDQLQEIGAIDPAAQQQLMADLKEAKPEHYSLIVKQFRAALAYREQMAARDQIDLGKVKQEQMTLLDSISSPATTVVASDQSPPEPNRPQRRLAEPQVVETRPAESRQPYERTDTHESHVQTVASRAEDQLADSQPLPRPAVRVNAANANPMRTDAQVHQVSHLQSTDQQPPQQRNAQQLSALSTRLAPPPQQGDDWEGPLGQAIAALARQAPEQPGNVEEIHQHMRLRALELLAGRKDEALRPIPGATPGQQDYWSKQLYALSTFLDSQTHADAKARSAAALIHLDEARGQLAELATLQVRNMAFVKSAAGFGEYVVSKETEFQPGAQVTVYAEVENYRSESTKKGFRTVLSTSYQVVDKAGQRVDGGQFPDIEDHCQNRRRDFHMQYTIPLPTRIYAGSYVMELIITDGLSNKIGRASVPFDIAE